jgi:transcription factor E2F3
MLIDEVDSLKSEEEKLDSHIAYMMNLVKSYSKCPRGLKVGKKGNPWMYIRKDDLTSLSDLKNETVIAVRAPAGTTLDVPDPNGGVNPGSRKYQMYFKSPGDKVDVFLIQYGDDDNKLEPNNDETRDLGETSSKRSNPSPETPDRKRQCREGCEWPDTPRSEHMLQDDNDEYFTCGLTPIKINQVSSPIASYYSSWEKHAALPGAALKTPRSPEQRDEKSEENSSDVEAFGFGSPPRNRSATGSPRLHREIGVTSSNSVVTNSTGNSGAKHHSPSRVVILGDSPVKMDKTDASTGSFDLMDDHFDDALMNPDKFFSHPLSPQNDDFLDFQPTD